ncbi:MAG TPA: TolC family protein, partial [Thermoanaerobaculia bacterium]|nr:TolC family protein [Thermoanaerobaculia bacterium]
LAADEEALLRSIRRAVTDDLAAIDRLREAAALDERIVALREAIERARERLVAEQALVAAEERPRLSAFARAGVGNPGLDFLDDSWNAYWLAGVRLSWTPWSWGTNERRRQALELRREALAADEEALLRSIRRAVTDDLAAIDRLREAAALDERIVALREAIERETRARYEERVVTAADYVDARTDLLEARLAAAGHRVELAQAEARLLAKLGLEVP